MSFRDDNSHETNNVSNLITFEINLPENICLVPRILNILWKENVNGQIV